MTLKLEKRYYKLMYEQSITTEQSMELVSDLSGIRHFLAYMVVRIISRPFFVLLAEVVLVIKDEEQTDEGAYSQFRILHLIFCFLTLAALIHTLFSLKELKVEVFHPAKKPFGERI